MSYKDLREWLQRVDAMGQLRNLDGVECDERMAALAELGFKETTERPSVLFDRIPGYADGRRILINMLGSIPRYALTMNMPPEPTSLAFVNALRRRLKNIENIPPRFVSDGPVMENVVTGSAINMLEFPAPMWHTHDGGRYLGTGSATITIDPEEGWVNLGTYRVMVHGSDTLGFYISPSKHGRIQREKYYAQNKSCPVAISFGHDPLLFLVGATKVPYGVSEYDVAGGIKGEPIEVVRGPVTGLPIPAHAEMVIEGESVRGDLVTEGPFGEYTGYYASSSRPEPVVKVKSVLYRNNPIICMAPPGRPPTDNTFATTYSRPALVWNHLEDAGVPDVRGVWTPESATSFMIVISLKQRYPGHSKQAAAVASQCAAGNYMNRYVIVVDEDIDPTNTREVIWALGSRCVPDQAIDILERCTSSPLDPAIHRDHKGFTSVALIDACRPYEWLDRFPPVVGASKELRHQVIEKWGAIILG